MSGKSSTRTGKTPGTTGTVRRPDRLLAAQLHQRGVPLAAVENALVLAAARRLIRPADAPPLGTIRSLAYFLPVIEEVLEPARQSRLLPLSAPEDRARHPNPVSSQPSQSDRSHRARAPSARMM